MAVNVWFRSSCISCIFLFSFTFCILLFFLFKVASSMGLCLSGNCEINMMMMMMTEPKHRD